MADNGTDVSNNNLPRMIWLTRPRFQVEQLKCTLEKKGFSVLHLPMLEIEPLKNDTDAKAKIQNLDQYSLIFFISTNAVSFGMGYIDVWWPQYPVGLQFFAVGPATAEALGGFGIRADYPRTGMSSEALLELPGLQDIAGKKALIFRGRGGREILAKGLKQKGAIVEYAEVYSRRQPQYLHEFLQACLARQKPDAIVITSIETLESFSRQFAEELAILAPVSLLVSSSRIAGAAKAQGFKSVTVMPGANDETILNAVDNLESVET